MFHLLFARCNILLADSVTCVFDSFLHILWQEYYTVHGVDASFVAREIFKSEGVLRYFGQGNSSHYVYMMYVFSYCNNI